MIGVPLGARLSAAPPQPYHTPSRHALHRSPTIHLPYSLLYLAMRSMLMVARECAVSVVVRGRLGACRGRK